MTHLLDMDTCSAHMERPALLAHRLILVPELCLETRDQHVPGLRLDDWLVS